MTATRRLLSVVQLEDRDAPATLVSPFEVTYQDADGDDVSVSFSKSILTSGNVNSVFAFGSGGVDGSNAVRQQLRAINLAGVGFAATGSAVTVTAARSPVHGGDGFAAVGAIDATGIDLGPVNIDGDLGRVLAGDGNTATAGLTGLAVQSLGRYGTSTGAPDLFTTVQGRLGYLAVKTDLRWAVVRTQGGPAGVIGPVFIGGSLVAGDGSGLILSAGDMGSVIVRGDVAGGGLAGSGAVESGGKLAGVTVGGAVRGGGGFGSGRILSAGDMGFVTIRGSLVGGGGAESGEVSSVGNLAGVTVGGSVIGGAGEQSGRIYSGGNVGTVTIRGDVAGAGGNASGAVFATRIAGVAVGGSVTGGAGVQSGSFFANQDVGFVTIGGGLTGGSGNNSGQVFAGRRLAGAKVGGSVAGGLGSFSGVVFASDAGFVTVRGDLAGGGGDESGQVVSTGGLAGARVSGSVIGGPGSDSGVISAAGEVGSVAIGGDLVGGSASGTGFLFGSGCVNVGRAAYVTLGGSLIAGTDTTTGTLLRNGAIEAEDDLGTVLVKGGLIGNATNPAIISARGQARPTPTADIAIGRLEVHGRAEFARILAGYDLSGKPVNADAQVGAVMVGGDWIASSLVAGALAGPDGFFGTADDAKMSGPGVKDDPQVFSKIASVTIGGQVLGTVGGADHYGIVAERVGAGPAGGMMLHLHPGPHNDDQPLGITGDFAVHEI